MNRLSLSCLLTGFVCFLSGAAPSFGGTFAVNPVRVKLADNRLVEALRVTNQGHSDAVLQVESTVWTQNEGKDVYTPTDELLVNPPIFSLPAGTTQTVRVGLLRAINAQQEKAYRVFFQEVPPAPEPDFKGLRVLLRIGVPVFVEPSVPAAASVDWQLRPAGRSAVRVVATNTGNAHVRIGRLSIYSVAGLNLGSRGLSDTVLPGKERAWQVDLAGPPADSGIRILADTDAGPIHGGPFQWVME